MSSKKIAYYQDSLENKTELITNLNHELRQVGVPEIIESISGDRMDTQIGQEEQIQDFSDPLVVQSLFYKDSFPFVYLAYEGQIINQSYVFPKNNPRYEGHYNMHGGAELDLVVVSHNFTKSFENFFTNIPNHDEYKLDTRSERRTGNGDSQGPPEGYYENYVQGENTVKLVSFNSSDCYYCRYAVERADIYKEIETNQWNDLRLPANIGISYLDLKKSMQIKEEIPTDGLIKVVDPLPVINNKSMYITLTDGEISKIEWRAWIE